MADGTKAGEKLHASELLKEDLASVLVVEPTVMADGTKAGEKLHASELLFPPATTTTTPEFTAPSTASRMACCVPLPPRLMLATAGRTWWKWHTTGHAGRC